VRNSQQQVSRSVYRVVFLQFIIASVFALLVAAFSNGHSGWSAACGGAIAVFGSFVCALFALTGSDKAELVLKAHMRAERIKIFITAVLFFLALKLFPSAAWLWLMLGFAVATMSYWFSLLAV
jgi:ATP synthase protein I